MAERDIEFLGVMGWGLMLAENSSVVVAAAAVTGRGGRKKKNRKKKFPELGLPGVEILNGACTSILHLSRGSQLPYSIFPNLFQGWVLVFN